MFGWFNRKRRIREQKKLLFQNSLAADGGILEFYFEQKGDVRTIARLAKIKETNRRIALSVDETGLVSASDLKVLAEMNFELREMFQEVETEDGEARVRHLTGQPAKPRDFDETYKPMVGWDKYYEYS